MKPSRELYVLIALLLLGALLRGLYLYQFSHDPGFYNTGVDAGYHDYWARGLATGDWTPPPPHEDPKIQSTAFFRPPGYPYFLGLVYKLTGCSYLWARIIQMLLGLLSVFVGFQLGRRWFGSAVGLIFAGLMSTYWVFIYFEGEFLEPVLLVLLGLLLVYELSLWTEGINLRRALLTGVIMGVFALVRPNILLFAPAALLWALWIMRRRGDLKPLKITVIGLVIGTGLAILPATIRNYVVARDFVPISSNGGINLYIGNNPYANGRVAGDIGDLGKFETCFDYPQIVRNLEAKLGTPLADSEVSKYFSDEAKDFMRTHPSDVMRLSWLRTLYFWGPVEVGHNKEDELERANSPILRNVPGNFASAFSLAIVGTALLYLDSRRRKKDKRAEPDRQQEILALVILFVVIYFASYLPFFVAGRYRVPVIPFLLLMGAYGIDRIVRLAVSKQFKGMALWLVLLGGMYALASVNFGGYTPDRAVWHYSCAVHYNAIGQPDAAIDEYREALKIKPEFPYASTNLGLLLLDKGNADEAMQHFMDALAIDQNNPWAHYGLGLVLVRQNKPDAALKEYEQALRLDPRLYMAHYRIGALYLGQGNTMDAAAEFSRALDIAPGLPQAHAGLGTILEGQGKLDEAAAHYAVSLQGQPDPVIHARLGGIYARQGKIDQAADQFSEAVRLSPNDPSAHYNLAVALERQKDLDGAIEQYKKTLELRPDHGGAHHNLAVALFFKGDNAGSWREVKLARILGVLLPPEFIQALSKRMAEPR